MYVGYAVSHDKSRSRSRTYLSYAVLHVRTFAEILFICLFLSCVSVVVTTTYIAIALPSCFNSRSRDDGRTDVWERAVCLSLETIFFGTADNTMYVYSQDRVSYPCGRALFVLFFVVLDGIGTQDRPRDDMARSLPPSRPSLACGGKERKKERTGPNRTTAGEEVGACSENE